MIAILPTGVGLIAASTTSVIWKELRRVMARQKRTHVS